MNLGCVFPKLWNFEWKKTAIFNMFVGGLCTSWELGMHGSLFELNKQWGSWEKYYEFV